MYGDSLGLASRALRDVTFRCMPPTAVYCQARRWYTKLAEAVRAVQTIPRAANQVRECGAQVEYLQILALSVCSYISALPQYLERFAARYANPLRQYRFCKFAHFNLAQVGSDLYGPPPQKKKSTTFVVLFCGGDPYGNRTHVFSVRG